MEQIRRKTFLWPVRQTQWVFCRPYFAILCVLPFFGCVALVPPSAGVRTIVAEPGGGLSSEASPNFGMAGRIAVKGSKESFSGGVQWRHTEGRDDILLLSPLGQALARLSRTPEGVQLTTAGRENYYAADMESLTEKVLGWRLPIVGLQYWVQGKNSPLSSSAIDLDDEGRVTAIRQDGWEIVYSGYFSPGPVQAAASAIPAAPAAERVRLLQLRRSGLQIKLVVDKWDQVDTGGMLN
jgi:outer membrane lipoprotein LolB